MRKTSKACVMARLKRILSLCTRRGFLLKRDTAGEGTREFDYGPSGAALKRNLVDEWLAPANHCSDL